MWAFVAINVFDERLVDWAFAFVVLSRFAQVSSDG
jgi:hypothetical protein